MIKQNNKIISKNIKNSLAKICRNRKFAICMYEHLNNVKLFSYIILVNEIILCKNYNQSRDNFRYTRSCFSICNKQQSTSHNYTMCNLYKS